MGYTALHGAAHRGAHELVQFLADQGATLTAQLTRSGGGRLGWTEGWTALDIADGQFYGNTLKRSPETAALLRVLLAEQGLPVETTTVIDTGANRRLQNGHSPVERHTFVSRRGKDGATARLRCGERDGWSVSAAAPPRRALAFSGLTLAR